METKNHLNHFGKPSVIVRSPGRINLIGEHTDYNEGLVLPAAIDKYVEVVASLHPAIIKLYSVQYKEEVIVEPEHIRSVPNHWTNYVLGVVHQLMKRGHLLGGFNMVIDGTVPVGAGMSSSAALECAVCKTLDVLFDLGLTQHEIILIVQAAEHEFAGVSCGIMDPFVSVRGKKDHALLLDCRSLDYEEVPLDLKGYRFVLLNSNVKHSLASSAYNQRREECSIGVRQIQRHLPGVQSMRDVTKEMLVEYIRDPLIHRRCRYVIEENERVRRAVACLKAGNIHGLGQQLFLSHDGLSLDYDVSSPELDWLVSSVRHRSYVAGARMMGGGFGGCTINLVREKFTEKLITELTETYERFIGLTLTAYAVKISDGTRVLTEKISA